MSQLVPRGPASLDRLEDCDTNMYSDWNSNDKRMLLPLDGLSGLPTGVQTATTPTLTPTTLRFAADLLALDDCETQTYHNEAGFVPPVVQTPLSSSLSSTYMVDSKSWQGGSVTTMASAHAFPPTTASVPTSSAATSVSPPAATPPTSSISTPARRNVGGRRPNKAKGISPEEEERRQVRRERNKAAAARCRKRRVDHTNSLVKETEGLEHKKQGLQLEIQELTAQVEDLEYILEAHRGSGTCHYVRPHSPPDVKPIVFPVKEEAPCPPAQPLPVSTAPTPAKRPMLGMPAPASVPAQPKPLRPTSLPVPAHTSLKMMASEVAGISITTPSTGIPLNFDSLMDGGTGLTPVSGPLVPSCSSQQRNQNCADLSSPDGTIGNKLVSL